MKNFIKWIINLIRKKLLLVKPVVGRSISKSKYWKDCPKCGLKKTYGQLITEEGYCWNCNYRGVF